MNNPTIAAISTPMSAGAIGLVRMSGPDAKAIAASVETLVLPGRSSLWYL